ncbi:unnamed protein product [Ectocarpus sp. 8 AP-2014]
MLRRVSSLVGRAAVRPRSVHTEAKLKELGIELPTPKAPLGNFVMTVRTGNLLYTSGHLPTSLEGETTTGKVGQELNEEEAQEAARKVALQLIASIKKDLGDLDRVTRIVKLVGFVNCTDGFAGQPKVVDGASDLFAEVFGERGVHSRSAVGTNALPMNVPVEIEAIVEFDDSGKKGDDDWTVLKRP